MQKEKEATKSNKSGRAMNMLCLLIILYFLAGEFSHLYRSLDTTNQYSHLFERHYSYSSAFPFAGSYFLMMPDNYNPARRYPLVVVLHGVSSRAYAAEFLARDDFRKDFPVFVMVPIAPARAFWATPEDVSYQMKRYIPYPDHLPQVMSGLMDIQRKYAIDAERIYIVGHSMGAAGVMGALDRYPEIFAAGVASSGAWNAGELKNMKSPLLVFHGDQDASIPVSFSKNLSLYANENHLPVLVTIIKGQGHAIVPEIYSNRKLWMWLMGVRLSI